MARVVTCRHFTGIQNDACKVGICYRDVRDESGTGPYRFPCLGEKCGTQCAKYEAHTEQEIRAEDERFAKRFEQLAVAREAIIATSKKQGRIDCTACKAPGALAFRIHSNGHVHAVCSTKGCLSWME